MAEPSYQGSVVVRGEGTRCTKGELKRALEALSGGATTDHSSEERLFLRAEGGWVGGGAACLSCSRQSSPRSSPPCPRRRGQPTIRRRPRRQRSSRRRGPRRARPSPPAGWSSGRQAVRQLTGHRQGEDGLPAGVAAGRRRRRRRLAGFPPARPGVPGCSVDGDDLPRHGFGHQRYPRIHVKDAHVTIVQPDSTPASHEVATGSAVGASPTEISTPILEGPAQTPPGDRERVGKAGEEPLLPPAPVSISGAGSAGPAPSAGGGVAVIPSTLRTTPPDYWRTWAEPTVRRSEHFSGRLETPG